MNGILYIIPELVIICFAFYYFVYRIIAYMKNENIKIQFIKPIKYLFQILFEINKTNKVLGIVINIALALYSILLVVLFIMTKPTEINILAFIIAVIIIYVFLSVAGIILESVEKYLLTLKDKNVSLIVTMILIHNVLFLCYCIVLRDVIQIYRRACWFCNFIFVIINLYILLLCLINEKQKICDEKNVQKWKFIIFMFFITVFSNINLIEVTRIGWNNAFDNMNSLLDSIYYVIITFSTVGYGDIFPTNGWGKVDACITSICSIVFLIAFFNTFLNRKEPFHETQELPHHSQKR